MTSGIRVLLVDDQQLFLEGLRALLSGEADMTVVALTTSGRDAVKLAHDVNPDVVVMDVAMPDLNGIEATRMIAATNSGARVLCLSMHGDERFVSTALQNGAAGYLLKEAATEELVSAVRAIASGQTYLSPAVAHVAVRALREGQSAPDGATAILTGREREVLQLIAEGQATRDIAARLHVSVKTVAAHRTKIQAKLEIHGIAELTKFAIREGIVAVDERNKPSAGREPTKPD